MSVWAGAIAALCMLACARAHAQQVMKPATLRLQGFAPDAQVVGGVGFGFGTKLKNSFLARGRLGLLYADEPWIVNLGATVEIGALGRLGGGAELELNGARGLFGAVGLARVSGKDWMTHVSVGFTVLGIEWQHRFGDERPSDALLLEVRLPLGTWWFLKQHEQPATSAPRAHTGPLQPQEFSPLRPPSAARGSASSAGQPPEHAGTAPAQPAVDPARVQEAQVLVAQARAAQARGQSADAALLLARAYTLTPEPAIALQLSAAEEAHGRWVLAAGDLRRALAAHTLPEPEQHRVAEQLAQLEARTPKLRVTLEHATGDELITIDGADAPGAGAGYDVAVDPGEHVLVVSRGGRELARSSFSAVPDKLTRVALELSKP